jgi:hypothetical protein
MNGLRSVLDRRGARLALLRRAGVDNGELAALTTCLLRHSARFEAPREDPADRCYSPASLRSLLARWTISSTSSLRRSRVTLGLSRSSGTPSPASSVGLSSLKALA